MVGLAIMKNFLKICLFVLIEFTNVTDRRTDGHHTTALMHSIAWQKREADRKYVSHSIPNAGLACHVI